MVTLSYQLSRVLEAFYVVFDKLFFYGVVGSFILTGTTLVAVLLQQNSEEESGRRHRRPDRVLVVFADLERSYEC
jgi:hypothetical protein